MLKNFDMDIFLSEVTGKFGITKSDIWKKQFSDLSDWFQNRDLSVSLEAGVNDEIMWDKKTVVINSNSKWEKRYYSLLHEAGHVIISEKPDEFSYNYPFYISEERRGRKGKQYKVSTIGEEIEAWKEGRILGDKILNHFVNYEKYNELMSDCIMSYVEWAAEE